MPLLDEGERHQLPIGLDIGATFRRRAAAAISSRQTVDVALVRADGTLPDLREQ